MSRAVALVVLAGLATGCDPRDRRAGPTVRRLVASAPRAPTVTPGGEGAEWDSVFVHETGSGRARRYYVLAGPAGGGARVVRAVLDDVGAEARLADDAPAEGFVAQALASSGWVFLTASGRVFGGDTFLGRLRGLGAVPCGSEFKRPSRGRAVLRAPDGALFTTDGRDDVAGLRTPAGTLDVAFADATHGAAVVEGAELHQTTDGGATWRRVEGPVPWAVEGHNGALVVEGRGGVRTLARDGALTEYVGAYGDSVEAGVPRPPPRDYPLVGDAIDEQHPQSVAVGAVVGRAARRHGVEVVTSRGAACRDAPPRAETDATPLRIRSTACRLRAVGRSPLPAGLDGSPLYLSPTLLWMVGVHPGSPDVTAGVAWSDQDARGRFAVVAPRATARSAPCVPGSLGEFLWGARTGALASGNGALCFVAAGGDIVEVPGSQPRVEGVARLRDGRAAVYGAVWRRPWGDGPEAGDYTVMGRVVVDDRGRASDEAQYVTAGRFDPLWVELPDGRHGPARFVGSDPSRLEALVEPGAAPREILRVDGALDAAPCEAPAPAPGAVTVHLAEGTYVGLEAAATRTDEEGDAPPFAEGARAVVEMTARSACVRSVTARGSSWHLDDDGGDGAAVVVTARGGVLSGYADSGRALYAITCRPRPGE